MTSTSVYPQLWHASFAGTLPGGEIFDHGLWFTQNTPGTDTDAVTAAQAWFAAFMGSPALSVGAADVRHLFDTNVVWTTVTVRQYSPSTGLPLGAPTTAANPLAGGGSGLMPPQDSVVVTLWNGVTIGRRRYNRFYLPPMEQSVLNANGRLFSGLPGDLGLACSAGNTAMGLLTPAAALCYWSDKGKVVAPLDATIVDDVVDTHRSRRNQLTPVKTTTPF